MNGEGGELARTGGGGATLGAVVFALGVIGRVLGTGGGRLGVAPAVASAVGPAGAFVTAAVFASGGAWLPAAGGAIPIVV